MGKPKQFAIWDFYSMGFSKHYMKHHALVVQADPCESCGVDLSDEGICYLQIGYEYSWRTRLKGDGKLNG